MPKFTEIEKTIPALYRRSVLNASMFAYVRAVRNVLPSVSVEMAIFEFMNDFGLTDDTFNSRSALVTFNMMQKELLELKRS